MADQDTNVTQQHTDDKEDIAQSTELDHVPPLDEHADVTLNVTQHHSEDGGSSSHQDNALDLERTITPSQTRDGSDGDYKREMSKNQESATEAEISKDETGEKEEPETTTSSTLSDKKDDKVDGPITGLNEGSTEFEDITTEARGDYGRGAEHTLKPDDKDMQENTPSPETTLPEEICLKKRETGEQRNNVENIGPSPLETTEPAVPDETGFLAGRYPRAVFIVVGVTIVAVLVQFLLQPESPPQKRDMQKIDIFLGQMKKVQTQFPNQRAELWNRSKIHLQRHLQTAKPTEPVSLILTAGLRAKRTLHCLAHGLASAFSSAINASILHIDGTSKAGQDSDQVKLDIDRKLQEAFEGDKPVAVIHHFEELPPGSTLIFYRYCDHENAAFKNTFLIFTVLLGEEEEIPAKIRLSVVEEMVDDHLKKKFLSHGHPVSFDQMDLDKYGGLWSRISHLILPVATEERIDREGCKGT
ncbi:torsin-1A-interacting protein 2-like isoform X2 [Mastacembelus armatus]|uniref:torsin-1A-interacting protein 2-like isoform X2 n=1 Tax=Mastacembelus armatus TaxID=205130 RepID=UPI000E458B28|nr:torsin-1A-interacting protein 2-like isoform X2 [Mastacembelus armatus]